MMMNYKKFGNTNLEVSEIGLGTEFLFHQPEGVVHSVVNKAIEIGINYFDILFSVKHYLRKLSQPINQNRDDIIITGHLGTTESDKRPKRNRNVKTSKHAFLNLLNNLQIDNVDVILVQYVKSNEYEKLFKPGGPIDLARSFQKEEKAHFLGLSTHDVLVAQKAIETGKFDMIMFPINIVNHHLPRRDELLDLCKRDNIGLVSIKPFCAGRILQRNRTVHIAKYQTGGISLKVKNRKDINPSICINYVRQYNPVSSVLMGVKNVEELNENMQYSLDYDSKFDYSSYIDWYQKTT